MKAISKLSGAVGQRCYGANTGYRHQAPAYVIIADDRQQATTRSADGHRPQL
jgi:hypothetical protein